MPGQIEDKIYRRQRLQAIREFAENNVYTTQEDLVQYLRERGFECYQGTISKDLRQMGYVPYVDRDGVSHLGKRSVVLNKKLEERYARVFGEAVLSAKRVGSLIILDTLPGCGQAVATILDASNWHQVIATFYGLNSVGLMAETEENAELLLNRIREGMT